MATSKYVLLALWTVIISLLTSSLTAYFLRVSELEFRDSKGKLRIRIGAYDDAGSIVLFADDGTRVLLEGKDRSRIAILSKTSSPVVVVTSEENGNFIGFRNESREEPSAKLYEGIHWPTRYPVTFGISSEGKQF